MRARLAGPPFSSSPRLTKRRIRPSFDDVVTAPHTPGAKLLASSRRAPTWPEAAGSIAKDLGPLLRVPRSTASVPALDAPVKRIDVIDMTQPPPLVSPLICHERTGIIAARRSSRRWLVQHRVFLSACLFAAAAGAFALAAG